MQKKIRRSKRYPLPQRSGVETEILCDSQTIECQLDDISISGIGAHANAMPTGLVNNSLVRVKFKTPTNQFKLTARVVYFHKIQKYVHKYGLEFVLDNASAEEVSNLCGLIEDDLNLRRIYKR